MRHHVHLYIFLGIMALTGGMLVRGAQYVNFAYDHNLSSNLQANLLSIAVDNDERLSTSRPVHMLFTGDVMLGRAVGKIMEIRGDYTYPFTNVASVLKSADLTIGNLEGPITEETDVKGSEYSFKFDPRVIEGLQESGFDVLSIANNHILDYGVKGIADTRYFLEHSNIDVVGAGSDEVEANKPVVKDIKGNKIAFLSYTDLYPASLVARKNTGGISRLDGDYITEIIDGLRKNGVDVVVVSMHWGEEYQKQANLDQKALARVLSASGADLIVGHHPHVTQEIEKIGDTWVVYSLGNFVFDQTFSEDVRNGSMLSVSIIDKEIAEVEEIPIRLNDEYQPMIVK